MESVPIRARADRTAVGEAREISVNLRHHVRHAGYPVCCAVRIYPIRNGAV